jgi:hypothetical protein
MCLLCLFTRKQSVGPESHCSILHLGHPVSYVLTTPQDILLSYLILSIALLPLPLFFFWQVLEFLLQHVQEI